MFLQEHIDAPEALYVKGHLPQSIAKRALLKQEGSILSAARMGEIAGVIRRSLDPNAPWRG